MADFVITNIGDADGGAGNDSVTAIYTVPGGVTMDLQDSGFGGFAGTFFGPGGNVVTFRDIERIGFEDRTASDDLVWTGTNADTILAGGGNDTIYTGGGDDIVEGGAGVDTWGSHLENLVGNTVIDLTAAQSTFGGSGRMSGIEGLDQLWLGTGNDRVVIADGQRLDDLFNAGGGDDTIQMGLGGADSLGGGGGNDLLSVRSTIAGGMTMDLQDSGFGGYGGTFIGPGGHAVRFSDIERFGFDDRTASDDLVWTGINDDTILAGGGNDSIYTGGGDDIVAGGAGVDTWGSHLENLAQDTVIDLTAAQSSFGDGGRISGIEGLDELWLGTGNDRVVIADGQRLDDLFNAGGGNDTIQMGPGGDDSISGGIGSDVLVLRSTIAGGVHLTELYEGIGSYVGRVDGPGLNDLRFSEIERFVFVDLARGNDRIWTGLNADRLTGGGGNDELDAGAGADRIDGGTGRDSLFGNTGNDRLRGGTGGDRLSGAAGRDTLDGGRGADRLEGGQDADRLTGGGDADRFVFGAGAGRDTITDFRAGGRDVIDLTALDLDFADIRIRDSADGADAVIILSAADRITVAGVDAADLTARMFDL